MTARATSTEFTSTAGVEQGKIFPSVNIGGTQNSGTTVSGESVTSCGTEFVSGESVVEEPAITNITQQGSVVAQPSESHSLAAESCHALDAEPDYSGKENAQLLQPNSEVKDLGWNANMNSIPAPLIPGLSNESLWMLIRRFNHLVYHVKVIPQSPRGGLDFNISDEEEFAPEKLRTTVERLYTTVIIGLISTANHIARLRSWRETRRTASFCAIYFLAWFFDGIIPTLMTTLVVIIVYPRSRKVLFPPAPVALVDSKTGGVKNPAAGVLGSHDTVTGTPENHQGEAVEKEASTFVSGLASILFTTAAGEYPQDKQAKEGDLDSSARVPIVFDTKMSGSNDPPDQKVESQQRDKTMQPMEEAMWARARPAMHALTDIADGWERFAKYEVFAHYAFIVDR
ncbi:hypothetical protein V1515DRAFT_67142 [Lipomyces mesembrius]